MFKSSFPQFLGGNPFKKADGCPNEKFGHDGKDNSQESTFGELQQ
jgi:hypothetical protein